MPTIHQYDPVAAIERIAVEISELYPSASVGLLAAATVIEEMLAKSRRDDVDRLALASHWES